MKQEHYLGILEGLLFAVGEEGVSLKQLVNVLDLHKEEVEALISELRLRYESASHGLAITELAQVFKMVTKKDHAPYFKKLLQNPGKNALTPAALEVLAIIAYKQPITRSELETIRGVNNDTIMKKLLMFDLITEAGRDPGPGRPILFKTTDAFLDYFGIKSLDELPHIEEDVLVEQLTEEKELFE